jgi:chemotaxis signal transduction protein
MRILVGLDKQEYTLETPMIITDTYGQTVALIVDEVQDVLELPEGCLQDAPPLHALSSKMIGVCRMPDGLMNLLDIDLLLSVDQFQGGR